VVCIIVYSLDLTLFRIFINKHVGPNLEKEVHGTPKTSVS